FNFLANRFVVFRKEHVRPKPAGGVLSASQTPGPIESPKADHVISSSLNGQPAPLPDDDRGHAER
ncbi:MAG: hypothetical protein AAFV29_24015, partial [Myxococcota bacterium]